MILPAGSYKISGTLTVSTIGRPTSNFSDQSCYIELCNGTLDQNSRLCLIQPHDIDYVPTDTTTLIHVYFIPISAIISSTEQLSIFIDINTASNSSISTDSYESYLIIERIN